MGPSAVLRILVETLPNSTRLGALRPRLPTAMSVCVSSASSATSTIAGASLDSIILVSGLSCAIAPSCSAHPSSVLRSRRRASSSSRRSSALQSPKGAGGVLVGPHQHDLGPEDVGDLRSELARLPRRARTVVAHDYPLYGPRFLSAAHDQDGARGAVHHALGDAPSDQTPQPPRPAVADDHEISV